MLFGSCHSSQEVHSWSEFIQLGPFQALYCWSINLHSQWKDSASQFLLEVDWILTEINCFFWVAAVTDSSRVGGSSSGEFSEWYAVKCVKECVQCKSHRLSWGDTGGERSNIHTTCVVWKLIQHTGLGVFSSSAALLVKACTFWIIIKLPGGITSEREKSVRADWLCNSVSVYGKIALLTF